MTDSNRFTLRPATLDDLAELVPIFNTCAEETGGTAEFTVEGYTPEWQYQGWDLAANTRVAVLPNGRLAGVIERWSFAPFVSNWLWARVHPEYRGMGIGTALMEWAEQRAREEIGRAPEGARVFMQANTASSHTPTSELLRNRGFSLIRHSLTMARELDGLIPEPVLPEGISIRPMRPGEERAVYIATDEAFQDHWGHVSVPLEEGFARRQARNQDDPNYDPSVWFLALEGDEIAGMALCKCKSEEFPEGGWVDTLGVRRKWRRHGLGLALLYHSFRELQARGREQVGLSVDASSLTGATRLYERAGMREIRRFDLYEKVLREGAHLTTQHVGDEAT